MMTQQMKEWRAEREGVGWKEGRKEGGKDGGKEGGKEGGKVEGKGERKEGIHAYWLCGSQEPTGCITRLMMSEHAGRDDCTLDCTADTVRSSFCSLLPCSAVLPIARCCLHTVQHLACGEMNLPTLPTLNSPLQSVSKICSVIMHLS